MSVLKLLEKRNLREEDLDSSDSESKHEEPEEDKEDEVEESAFKEQTEKQWKNRCRVLVVAGRGSAPGFRHLVKDLVDLLPHSKKEVMLHVLSLIGKSK